MAYGIGLMVRSIIKATGGDITITPGDGYTYHIYTQSGVVSSFNVTKGGNVDYLILAGGGSGGVAPNDYGTGGAGAGGCLFGSINIDTGNYAIYVGNGGVGVTTTVGNNGETSSFGSFFAFGGQGSRYLADSVGGGCGAGAASQREWDSTDPNNKYQPGSGSANQGFRGGYGAHHDSMKGVYGGGGGGIAEVGQNGHGSDRSTGYGGNGGSGSAFSRYFPGITSGSQLGLPFTRFGGGGGGAGYPSPTHCGKATDGGIGGKYRQDGDNAENNRGGGGGGIASNPSQTSGNGGSGFVIIRYKSR